MAGARDLFGLVLRWLGAGVDTRVPPESRTFYVLAENRAFSVAVENRVFVVVEAE